MIKLEFGRDDRKVRIDMEAMLATRSACMSNGWSKIEMTIMCLCCSPYKLTDLSQFKLAGWMLVFNLLLIMFGWMREIVWEEIVHGCWESHDSNSPGVVIVTQFHNRMECCIVSPWRALHGNQQQHRNPRLKVRESSGQQKYQSVVRFVSASVLVE